MASSINLSLTSELRRYVDERASDDDLYSTPSEYIRDLIRQDMQNQAIASHVMEGINDIKAGRFSDLSIDDILDDKH